MTKRELTAEILRARREYRALMQAGHLRAALAAKARHDRLMDQFRREYVR